MFETILNEISSFPPIWIYITLFLFAFVENVFPPSPSDFVVVVGGSLIATGSINFIPTLILTSLGTVIGFMVLFYIGSTVDKKVIHAGKLKFIPVEAIDKVELWFKKYGYGIILANRFMPGTRAVISFFAGLSHLHVKKTIIFSTFSAFAWNTLILYLGYIFGDNVEIVDEYLTTYTNIVIVITVVVALFFIIRFFLRKRKSKD
ncbi:MAG: DedA family protein [Ignavibacteriaceae bacterium]|nr:DedA family protein [Ignavibacteriaceae bacterium]